NPVPTQNRHKIGFSCVSVYAPHGRFYRTKDLRNYLHPHIEYVKGKYQEMHDNEANLNKQELKELENLAKQLSELKEYEQVSKDLANKKNTTFDLDNGVTVNYAKFEGAVAIVK